MSMKLILARLDRFPGGFLSEIECAYERCQSVRNVSGWLKAFDSVSSAIERGQGSYRQAENVVFELKVINFIRGINPECAITYGPKGLKKIGKGCDLLVEARSRYLIELKSFHPQYLPTPIPHEHITEGNEVIMDAHSYHNYQSVRGHLIDEVLDTEEKMNNYKSGAHIKVFGALLGFYLHLEDLRDFITIYRKGKYRFDDPLGKMTLHNLRKGFQGNIHEFWGFPFNQIDFNFMEGKEAVAVDLSMTKDVPIRLLCQLTTACS